MVDEIDRSSLRSALAALAVAPGDERARSAVFGELLTDRLLVPLGLPDPGAEQPASVTPGELHMMAMPRDDAEPTALCFSGAAPARRLGIHGPAAMVRLPDFWGFLLERGLRSATIDAGGPVAVTLAEGELAALAEGRVPVAADTGAGAARLALGRPRAPVPPAVADAVAAIAAAPEVLAAYVLEGDGWPDARHLVAALELPPEADADAVLAAAWAALEPHAVGDGWRLSATPLEPWEAELIRSGAGGIG